jgi:hypothetical protein
MVTSAPAYLAGRRVLGDQRSLSAVLKKETEKRRRCGLEFPAKLTQADSSALSAEYARVLKQDRMERQLEADTLENKYRSGELDYPHNHPVMIERRAKALEENYYSGKLARPPPTRQYFDCSHNWCDAENERTHDRDQTKHDRRYEEELQIWATERRLLAAHQRLAHAKMLQVRLAAESHAQSAPFPVMRHIFELVDQPLKPGNTVVTTGLQQHNGNRHSHDGKLATVVSFDAATGLYKVSIIMRKTDNVPGTYQYGFIADLKVKLENLRKT